MRSKEVRDLVIMAFYLALFFVLDLISNFLPTMPNGGSFGLGTIALLMASYQLGWKKGVAVSLLSVLLQFITGRMFFTIGFVFDYVIAFGVYGIACLFPNFGFFYSGVLITNLIRLLSSTFSGVIAYDYTWWASFLYNVTYMLPTIILGLILIPLLIKYLKIRIHK